MYLTVLFFCNVCLKYSSDTLKYCICQWTNLSGKRTTKWTRSLLLPNAVYDVIKCYPTADFVYWWQYECLSCWQYQPHDSRAQCFSVLIGLIAPWLSNHDDRWVRDIQLCALITWLGMKNHRLKSKLIQRVVMSWENEMKAIFRLVIRQRDLQIP